MKAFFRRSLLCFLVGAPAVVFGGEPLTKEKQSGHTEHHNRYEVELSYNDTQHLEFTGSLYFAHLTKVQGTMETTGKHYAAVVVRELPFHGSHFGTFFGMGSTFAVHDEPAVHSIIKKNDTMETEVETSLIVQSGLAYSINSHWSTGFTYSPGVSVKDGHFEQGLTFDLVYGF